MRFLTLVLSCFYSVSSFAQLEPISPNTPPVAIVIPGFEEPTPETFVTYGEDFGFEGPYYKFSDTVTVFSGSYYDQSSLPIPAVQSFLKNETKTEVTTLLKVDYITTFDHAFQACNELGAGWRMASSFEVYGAKLTPAARMLDFENEFDIPYDLVKTSDPTDPAQETIEEPLIGYQSTEPGELTPVIPDTPVVIPDDFPGSDSVEILWVHDDSVPEYSSEKLKGTDLVFVIDTYNGDLTVRSFSELVQTVLSESKNAPHTDLTKAKLTLAADQIQNGTSVMCIREEPSVD